MSEHDLKVWPEFYAVLESGEKTFELRRDDRGFKAGDTLLLREWNPRMEAYTGNLMRRQISYLMAGPAFGLAKDWVAMALASPPASLGAPREPAVDPCRVALAIGLLERFRDGRISSLQSSHESILGCRAQLESERDVFGYAIDALRTLPSYGPTPASSKEST